MSTAFELALSAWMAQQVPEDLLRRNAQLSVTGSRPETLRASMSFTHHPAMPTVVFTPQLRRFTETPEVATDATDLRAALEDAFAANPRLRGYVLDDQGHVRANVVIFIDGRRCDDRVSLAEALQTTSRIHVMQALSGG